MCADWHPHQFTFMKHSMVQPPTGTVARETTAHRLYVRSQSKVLRDCKVLWVVE